MLAISVTEEWRTLHPGALIGLLELSGITDNSRPGLLGDARRKVETELRSRYQGFTRQDWLRLPVMAAYDRYYKRFRKTYHVLLQVESIVLKGKALPDALPLVSANFLSELETLVLTAGHDVARLQEPITIDVSRAGEGMHQMNGVPRTIHEGDMVMRDAGGISCSIIYGQDDRSPISPDTSHVLYVAYAPCGVPPEAVERQLEGIEANIRLFCPSALMEQRRVIGTTPDRGT